VRSTWKAVFYLFLCFEGHMKINPASDRSYSSSSLGELMGAYYREIFAVHLKCVWKT
jgi:hypothetical protein